MQCNCPINKLLSQGCKCGAFIADQNKQQKTNPPYTWGIVLNRHFLTSSQSYVDLTHLATNYTFTKDFNLIFKYEVEGEGMISIIRDGQMLVGSIYIAPIWMADSIQVKLDPSQLPLVCNKISIQWAASKGIFNIRNAELTIHGN